MTPRALSQLFYDPSGCGLRKMAVLYFSDFWNKLDVAAILLFVAGLACRWAPPGQAWDWARPGHPLGLGCL